MKPHSIDDVLHKFVISALGTKDTSYEAVQKKARQALYEAVKSCVPDEEMMQEPGDDLWTWNDCRTETLRNLAALFGISKEGENDGKSR